MHKIIDLLRKKNEYLHNFFAINENEILNFAEGNFENLEGFYLTRDKILEFINDIDVQVTDLQNQIQPGYIADEVDRNSLQLLLENKDELVKEILAQDLQILSTIESEKSNLLKELGSIRQTKRALQGYHSGNYNKHLDEEA